MFGNGILHLWCLDHYIKFQIGSNKEKSNPFNPLIQSTNCTSTCPEDCANETWSLVKDETKEHTNIEIHLSCSKIPSVTETVEECMKDFDFSKHPNMELLPNKKCGKQSTGAYSTVKLKTLVFSEAQF